MPTRVDSVLPVIEEGAGHPDGVAHTEVERDVELTRQGEVNQRTVRNSSRHTATLGDYSWDLVM